MFFLRFTVFIAILTCCCHRIAVLAGANVPVGTIWPFAGEHSPDGWMLCDGRTLNRAEYKELFAVIGIKYSINVAQDTFVLPDLRGRTVVGAGLGAGLTQRNVGTNFGVEKHTLSVSEMPAHSHNINDPGHGHPVSYTGWFVTYSNVGSTGGNSGRFYGTSHVLVQSAKTGISVINTGNSIAHENMPPSLVLNFIINVGASTPLVAPTTTLSLPTVVPWPKPEKLLGCWPLNAEYTNYDVSSHRFNGIPTVNRAIIGPFGDRDTAMEPAIANSTVLEVAMSQLKIVDSFTVTLFFKGGDSNTTQEGGIFEFIDSLFKTTLAFQLRYINSTTIEVSANNFLIGTYTLLQQKGVWTFMAFVFDGETTLFSVYSRHGLISPPKPKPHIFSSNTFNNGGVRLGWASRWQQGLQKNDGVSCLMVYSTALTANEIRQTQVACRVIHKSPPCGAPKMPLQPIPTTTSITTVAKAGQFPFVASLRLGNSHICSASIIDPFWLLTSAVCFQKYKTPDRYSVYVGEYNLFVNETYTRIHSVAKVILPAGDSSDVALMEVTEPIDISSNYVNDACFFKNTKSEELKIDLTQFVFGWGKNGRRPMVLSSLGRYVPGLMMTDTQCIEAWGAESYKPMKDFCFMSASNDKNVPCVGDEGSALLMQAHSEPNTGVGDRLIQVGVYYKRDANCSVVKPPLFTNIAQYSTWIAEKIACAVPGIVYPDKCPQDV